MRSKHMLSGSLFACLFMVAHLLTTSHAARADAVSLQRVLAATDWLNSKPTPRLVRGKVVVLDFYTFECINCKHVQPNLRALYRDKSRNDLVILSVHSPETSGERSREILLDSLKD